MGQGATSAERLAAWSAGLVWRDVPGDQRSLVGLRVLDTVGLVLAGYETQAARAAFAIGRKQGGTAESALFLAGERTSAATAALVHGTVAHCRDFDDTFLDSVVHPGSTVIAAALAVGEAERRPDEEIATAILAGYEAAARIGAAAGRRFHARGFHASGIVGPLGATLVAARLYRLSPAATADALGLAASMSGGLMAFLDDGAWSKWLHVGWSAHGGIIAAQLAGQGFRGPRGALDGRDNLFVAFIDAPAPGADALCGDLGHRWQGGTAHFKYYPCAHVIQPYIDAAIALRRPHRLLPSTIERVTCTIAPWAVPIVCTPRAPKLCPPTDMDAIASLPYQVAVALVDGHVDLEALGPACRARAEVLDLATRIEHAADDSPGGGFDGAIAIRLKSGEILQSSVVSAPPDRNKLLAKFRANARRAINENAAAALEETILGSALPRFGELAVTLSKSTYQGLGR
jgi:2-methylcitrate dehydratase PrpD